MFRDGKRQAGAAGFFASAVNGTGARTFVGIRRHHRCNRNRGFFPTAKTVRLN
jgi:hypothetical protein